MTIFDYIKDIVVTKKGDLPLNNYVPFLINRWLSFINPTIVKELNKVNSKILLEDKTLHYQTMITIFPKLKYCPRINYVKKVKEDEAETSNLKLMSGSLELSEREILWLIRESSS